MKSGTTHRPHDRARDGGPHRRPCWGGDGPPGREVWGSSAGECGGRAHPREDYAHAIRQGCDRVGAGTRWTCPRVIEIQRIAGGGEAVWGIPLLIGRDVIHGFRTVSPSPWDRRPPGTRTGGAGGGADRRTGRPPPSGVELDLFAPHGWTRSGPPVGAGGGVPGGGPVPVVRAGRRHGAGGSTGSHLDAPGAIAACAKHFTGYGASEGGRD